MFLEPEAEGSHCHPNVGVVGVVVTRDVVEDETGILRETGRSMTAALISPVHTEVLALEE